MPTTPTTDPLAQREELRDQLVSVGERGAETSDQLRAAKQAAHEAEVAFAHARIDEARGKTSPADVRKAEHARDKANDAVAELTEKNNTYAAARRAVERDLWKCHWHNRAAFEAECDEKSKAAEAAVRALNPALQEAARLWADADAAWKALERQLIHVDAPALAHDDPFTMAGNPQAPYGMPAFPVDMRAPLIEARPFPRDLS